MKSIYYRYSNYIKNAARTHIISRENSNVKDFYKIVTIYTTNYRMPRFLSIHQVGWVSIYACALQLYHTYIVILLRR